jgi:putative DNA primase/helicase
LDILHHEPPAACGNAEILLVQPANIPEQLRLVPQWLVWRIKPNGHKKPKKVPVSPKTGREIDYTNRRNLMGFDGAVSLYLNNTVHGIGFAFTAADPFAGVDLDRCRNPMTCNLEPFAESLLKELDTYAEVSVSGTGVHAIALAAHDPTGPKRRAGIELYDRARYFTFTGHRLAQTPLTVEDREPVLRAIQDRLREARKPPPAASGRHSFGGPDAALLTLAFGAKNGSKVRAYWYGERMGKPSASEALLGLARLLAFYTGPDEARLERLIVGSPLFAATETERPKWTSARPGGTWGGVYVVRKAIESCTEYYKGGVRPGGVRLSSSSVLGSLLNSPPPV